MSTVIAYMDKLSERIKLLEDENEDLRAIVFCPCGGEGFTYDNGNGAKPCPTCGPLREKLREGK